MIGRSVGRVVATRGPLVEAELPGVRVGDGVRIGGASALGAPARTGVRSRGTSAVLAARVAGLHGSRALLAPFGAADGIAVGERVEADPDALALVLGTPLLGRAIDAAGVPLDGRPAARGRRAGADSVVPAVAERRPCGDVLWTGVRAIDGPLAFGRGARIGLFGAPGAGKSTLLEAVVRGADADAVVVGLVGERGREAERWLARLDPRTTLVCATGDRAPAERVRAAEVAFAQADALRARGLDVLLVLDSLARVCAAAREIGLAAGEPAGRGGYPPGVFALLARLLERAGAAGAGSVSLVATVLSDGPDEHDPVSEAARAALDGHLVLSERLARAGRFPALDLAKSASRTLADVAAPDHLRAAQALRAAVAVLEGSRDARALGLDPGAGDPFLARCIALEPELERFLRQEGAPCPPARTLTDLLALADRMG
ncbi:MAG: synthase in type secretion protein [Candidatus Eremiobacteraeota bacterium]|jgi:FliI/YscN family ATPase|nr:synthase in type secretion protein [Candidatus Eremiobacteraeota bacterium]